MPDIHGIIKEGYLDPIEEMQDLCEYLNLATEAYDKGEPVISDRRWDDRYYRLCMLEAQTGMVLPQSPTQKIHFEVRDALPKIKHEHPMLSLPKTKEIAEIDSFVGTRDWVAMGKMDGLTCSLTYEQGKLVRAETRGNGVEGEDILHNARVNLTIPQEIPYMDKIVIDGEIICTYENFERFKDTFKNPRNLAAGSIRLLNSKESRDRLLTFVVWDVIEPFPEIPYTLDKQLGECEDLGFYVTPFILSSETDTEKAIDFIKSNCSNLYPIDGVVFKYNDLSLRESLGSTSHHFNNAMAYKFFDEVYETKLRDIEWTMGRTGVLTPVAVFDPVDADGSVIERASLHNVSVMQELLGEEPWNGQSIRVFKANMIIPQIYDADRSGYPVDSEVFITPSVCPVCGGEVKVHRNDDVVNAMCENPACEGKLINRLDHYLGKKGIDAKGISTATLEKLIDWGWVYDICDLYHLDDHADVWKQKDGFGPKSVEKIINSILEASKDLSFERFVCALGIPLVGTTVSKQLGKVFSSYSEFREAVKSGYDFYSLPNFGPEKHSSIVNFDYNEGDRLAEFYVTFSAPGEEEIVEQKLDGKTIVITGKLVTYKNRAELQAEIEKCGGKVTGSVSKNTDYLINNDKASTSSKNVSAQKLGIPIITEAEFKDMFLT